jgi:hypothetical protein
LDHQDHLDQEEELADRAIQADKETKGLKDLQVQL